jgi:hypothetical protein
MAATANSQLDISDNAARGAMLSELIQAASRHAPKTARQSWDPEVAHPDLHLQCAAVGSTWKLHNDFRVMSQYGRVLKDACTQSALLNGAPSTCVEGFEWFQPFAHPVSPLAGQALELVSDFVSACVLHKGGTQTPGEAAFDAHRSIMHPDRQLTQFLVEHHFPGPRRQFELDVCAYMLARPSLTYGEWKERFPEWRNKGLYFCLGLASMYMPSLADWLPEDAHESKLAMTFDACLYRLRVPGQDHSAVFAKLAEDWAKDSTGAADVLSGKLDRLAILMGVKSNGSPFDLAGALRKFADHFPTSELGAPASELHRQNYAAWHCLKAAVEETFPPSLLSAPLVRPKRETWGYPRLTLSVQRNPRDAPSVLFAERSLEHVIPKNFTASVAHTYQPAYIKDCALHQPAQRIQDALWRLGEIATSPSLSLCMVRPDVALENLLKPPELDSTRTLAFHMTVGAALDKMCTKPIPLPTEEGYVACMEALDLSVPEPVTTFLPTEKAVLFWRLDTPPRAILYVGADPAAALLAQSTHHLEKVMINCKVPHRATGGILEADCASTEEAVRDALRAFARDGLSTHPANTVLITQSEVEPGSSATFRQVAPVTCTTLAESVACFTLTRPKNLTFCTLGGSSAWKEDGIDPRYAERQLAENGFRFRDWTALYVGNGGTQQSRLASHLVKYDSLHTAVAPWFLDQGGIQWVETTSTLPPEPRTLHGKSLRHAVESRFMHDLRMLPTEPNCKVSKANCEIYADPSGMVGVVYSHDCSTQLHFICFQIKNQPAH